MKHKVVTTVDEVVSVRLSSEIVDEEEYKVKHAIWAKEKEAWEEEELAKFYY